MAEVPLKLRTWSQREASASLFCLAFVFFFVSQAPAAVWYLNDSSAEGDCITQSTGDDRAGDGSAAKPFRSLNQVLLLAKDGDSLKLDAGDYDVPSLGKTPAETKPFPITLSRFTVEGAGTEKTRIHALGKAGLIFAGSRQLKLKDFSITGGDASLLLDHCSKASLTHLHTLDSTNYGILIKDSRQNRIEECQTSGSGFRGLQLRRSSNNIVLRHLSLKNTNAGICLEGSGENLLKQCHSEENGLGGFYVFRKSDQNRLENCSAEKNRLSGFYLDRESTQNRLLQNDSSHNERGYTLNNAPDNFLEENKASFNDTFGFWIKEKSSRVRLEGNRAVSNGNSGFLFTPDSPPALFGKNLSRNNRFPDALIPPAPDVVTASIQARN